MLKNIILSIICLPISLSALIVKSDHLDDLNKYVKPDTLVLLNIDAAVVDSAIFLGSDPWYSYLKAKVGIDTRLYYKLMIYITQKIPLTGVEDDTAAIIRSLQMRCIPVLALTGRGKDHLHELSVRDYDKQTLQELKQAGVDFSKSVPSQLDLTDGILFAEDNDKGLFLKAFLEKSGYFPRRIIFVSKLSHLTSVEKAMAEMGIDFVGIDYGFSRPNFDLLAALMQLKALLEQDRCLSDAEAIVLKPTGISTDEIVDSLLLKFQAFLSKHPKFPNE